MSIDTGSDAANLQGDEHTPADFHVSFHIHWVPPKLLLDAGKG